MVESCCMGLNLDRLVRLPVFNLEALADLLDLFVSDLELVGLCDDLLVVGQQFELRIFLVDE